MSGVDTGKTRMNNKVELLAPAGNLEKLKMAIIYGADAVYLDGEEFGLRASAGNFGPEELRRGVDFTHSRGKGRCLLSNYMADRDSNRGLCAHPCRWKYQLVEEKRPSEHMPVFENDRGTYIFNSKDLCLIGYIPEIIDSGVTSLKIEGRMKSSYYVATVVKAYREALDAYAANPLDYRFDKVWFEEISKASHREYTSGFCLGKPSGREQIYESGSYCI